MCSYFSTGDNNEGGGTSNLESDTPYVIGGILGGVVLFFTIIFVFCIVLCSMRWFYNKKEVAKLKSSCNVNITPNPSYDTNKRSVKQEYQTHEYETPNEFIHLQLDTINCKLDSNPSHKKIQEHKTIFDDSNNEAGPEHDVPVQLNSSCKSKPTKISEDHDGYVEVDLDHLHSTEGTGYLELLEPTTKEKSPAVAVDAANVTINPNPSYELMKGGVELQDNPSYTKLKTI